MLSKIIVHRELLQRNANVPLSLFFFFIFSHLLLQIPTVGQAVHRRGYKYASHLKREELLAELLAELRAELLVKAFALSISFITQAPNGCFVSPVPPNSTERSRSVCCSAVNTNSLSNWVASAQLQASLYLRLHLAWDTLEFSAGPKAPTRTFMATILSLST